MDLRSPSSQQVSQSHSAFRSRDHAVREQACRRCERRCRLRHREQHQPRSQRHRREAGLMSDEEQEVFMEDSEAKERSEKNPQGADKRAPDREQGESVPAGANDSTAADAGTTTGGADGAPSQGGAGDAGGGASYGGGTGN